jgi:tRNA-splicing ligase RtcB
MPQYEINLPDAELAGVPLSSAEGQKYFKAMSAAANFAWANRQLITSQTREAWAKVLGKAGGELAILYDVAHNIAKIEEHATGNGTAQNDKTQKVIVHRKGATRAFPPGHPEITEAYRAAGQPVLIPGSMGTASYVLAGDQKSMQQAFGSTCHGAGRRMSRHAALKTVNLQQLTSNLKKDGIQIMAGSMRGLAEEAPLAYKDVDQVVEIVDAAGLAKKVARLKPLVVVKG